MPSKYSPRTQRPPSPYSVSQSPRRPRSQQRVWRSLSSTGEASSTNSFAEKSRETWLKSLRQGTDPKRSPVKGNHNLNNSLSSTSDYLRDQLGLPPNSARKHKRSNSVDLSQSSSPSFKSSEDMYDEIISLKKTIVAQKNEYDVLKAKTRRLEEENKRKEKHIQQLLDPKASDESIRRLAESGSQSGSAVASGLKQKILKLEKQVRDKDNELNAMKSDVKMTDIAEMKTAMEMYYQEVLRLREVISSQEAKSERLTSSLRSERDAVPSKVKALRRNVVQLTAENHQIMEDNKKLRRDLDTVLNGDDGDASGSEGEEEIKYSALGRVELVTMIKKMKKSDAQKAEVEKNRKSEETDKMKSIIARLKEEKNESREESKKLREQNESLENDLDKQTDKVSHLRNEMESLKERVDTQEENRREEGRDDRRQRRDSHSGDRNRSIERQPKKRPRTADRNKAASAIQRQWREHQNKKLRKDDDIVALQSALRGHLTRTEHLDAKRGRSPVGRSQVMDDAIISETSDSDEEVVYLQSAMRGHLERRGNS